MDLNTVLVPLDGSELAESVLPLVQTLVAGDPSASVVLLHVVGGDEEDVNEEERLAELRAARARGLNLPARIHLSHGDAATEILSVAQVVRPAVVAMASHGRTGMSRLVRGSVTERVLRSCPFPLLVVRPSMEGEPEPSFRRILVPLDGSELADRVLPYAETLAKTFDAQVTLLRVETPVDFATRPQPQDPARIAATLSAQRERLAAAGVQVEARGVQGHVVREILRCADESDLVVMSTHGRAGVSRWWFGSVAEQVLRHCSRPVFVLRQPDNP